MPLIWFEHHRSDVTYDHDAGATGTATDCPAEVGVRAARASTATAGVRCSAAAGTTSTVGCVAATSGAPIATDISADSVRVGASTTAARVRHGRSRYVIGRAVSAISAASVAAIAAGTACLRGATTAAGAVGVGTTAVVSLADDTGSTVPAVVLTTATGSTSVAVTVTDPVGRATAAAHGCNGVEARVSAVSPIGPSAYACCSTTADGDRVRISGRHSEA